MKRFACALLIALLLGSGAALAQPAPPHASLDQRIGAQVPLDVAATDDAGLSRRLSDFVDGSRPVLLVPGYYHCPELCGLVMHGLLDALQQSGVPRERWRIVGVGLDANETTRDARARRELDLAYADFLTGAQGSDQAIDLHLLTLAGGARDRITRAIGERFEPQRSAGVNQIAHPATVVLLTPRGEVARYFNGVGIDAGELRVALADAAGDRLGSVTGRLALLCAHFDPRTGRYNDAVMNGIRAMSAVLVLLLAAWWLLRRKEGR